MSYTPLTHFLRVVTTPLIQRLSAQLLPASGVRMYGCILNNKQSATPSPIMSLRNGQVPKSLPKARQGCTLEYLYSSTWRAYV